MHWLFLIQRKVWWWVNNEKTDIWVTRSVAINEGHFLERHLLLCVLIQYDLVLILFSFRSSRKCIQSERGLAAGYRLNISKTQLYKQSCLSQSLQDKQRLPGPVCGVFFWTRSFHLGKGDLFVYPLHFLVARSMFIFVYMVFECPVCIPRLSRNEPKTTNVSGFLSHYSYTSVHVLELCQCFHTNICVSWREGYEYVFTGQCPWAVLQGKLRAEIHCISGKVDLRFWLGSWMEATLPYQSISPLDVKVALILQPVFCFQTCRTRQVPKGYPPVLPGELTMARRGPGGCQQAHTATGCGGTSRPGLSSGLVALGSCHASTTVLHLYQSEHDHQ